MDSALDECSVPAHARFIRKALRISPWLIKISHVRLGPLRAILREHLFQKLSLATEIAIAFIRASHELRSSFRFLCLF